MKWYHSRLLSCFEVRKINAVFLIKQKILHIYIYMIMSFENLYLFKLYALIKYKFCLKNVKNGFENVHDRD